jgi:hypothetical protein
MTDDPAQIDEPGRGPATLTVTLFGDHDAIDQAISDELGRRGCRTHSISVKTGWLASTTNAVVRLDTAAGASALEGLTVARGPSVHVIAICVDSDTADSGRLRHICEDCSSTHDVSLLRHAPLAVTTLQPQPGEAAPPVRHLALAVADVVADQTPGSAAPSFTTRSVAI